MTYDYYGAWGSKWGAFTGLLLHPYYGQPQVSFRSIRFQITSISGFLRKDECRLHYEVLLVSLKEAIEAEYGPALLWKVSRREIENVLSILTTDSCYRYWQNVGAAINETDEMWRRADAVGGVFQGGYVPWRDIGIKLFCFLL